MRRTLFEDAGSAGRGGEEGGWRSCWRRRTRSCLVGLDPEQTQIFIHAAPPFSGRVTSPSFLWVTPTPAAPAGRGRILPPAPDCPIFPSPPKDIPDQAAHPLPNSGSFPIFIKKRERKKKKKSMLPQRNEKKNLKTKKRRKNKLPEPRFLFTALSRPDQCRFQSQGARPHGGKVAQFIPGPNLRLWSWRLYRWQRALGCGPGQAQRAAIAKALAQK